MSDYIEDPDFDYVEEIRDKEPTQDDWEEEPKYQSFKTEFDAQARIIQPFTKIAYKIGKGIDPTSKKIRTGVIPSGFMEANTPDLTTANLQVDSLPKNYDERFNIACNNILASLINFSTLTGIDVTPSYNLVLLKRDLYNSMSKARKGILMNYTFVKQSNQMVTNKNIASTTIPKKKNLVDKVFGNGENYSE